MKREEEKKDDFLAISRQGKKISKTEHLRPLVIASQPRLNREDLSFLVRTIKDLLKEDLGKEIQEIKQRLNPSVPLLQATNTQIQQPNLYSLQVVPPPQ